MERELKGDRYLGYLLVISGSIFIFVFLRWLFSFGVDDSYIFYRYAENIANGHGFVFNWGEQAGEGFTSWTWTLLLAGIYKLGMNIVMGSKIMGILFHLASGLLVYKISKILVNWVGRDGETNENSWLGTVAAIFVTMAFLGDYRLLAHSVSGMETALYVFSILLPVFIWVKGLSEKELNPSYWLYGGLATTWVFFVRPEGLAVGGLCLLALALGNLRDLLKWKTWFYLGASVVLPVVLFVGMKMMVFGYPLPQSFYHKFIVRGWEYGESARQIVSFLKSYIWLVLPVLPVLWFVGIRRKNGRIWLFPVLFLGMVSIYLLFYPVMNYLFRFYIPYISLLWILVGIGVYLVLNWMKIRGMGVGLRALLIVIFALLWGILNLGTGNAQKTIDSWTPMVNRDAYRARLGVIMKDLPKEVVVANSEMGVIPYYSGLTCLDMAGLTDPYMAHHGMSMDYLMKRGTSLILFPRDVMKIKDKDWNSFGLNYKSIFESEKFLQDFELLGAFNAWPKSNTKYYIYGDKTSKLIVEITKWRNRYAQELNYDGHERGEN